MINEGSRWKWFKIITFSLMYADKNYYPEKGGMLKPEEWCEVCDTIDFIKKHYADNRTKAGSFEKAAIDARIYALDNIFNKIEKEII